MEQADPQPGEDLGGQVRPAPRWRPRTSSSFSDSSTSGIDDVGLPAGVELGVDHLADLSPLLGRRRASSTPACGPGAARRSPTGRGRRRRSAPGSAGSAWPSSPARPGARPCAIRAARWTHAEAVLLVHHHHAQALEDHLLLDEGVEQMQLSEVEDKNRAIANCCSEAYFPSARPLSWVRPPPPILSILDLRSQFRLRHPLRLCRLLRLCLLVRRGPLFRLRFLLALDSPLRPCLLLRPRTAFPSAAFFSGSVLGCGSVFFAGRGANSSTQTAPAMTISSAT